jgi:hypothetical protein
MEELDEAMPLDSKYDSARAVVKYAKENGLKVHRITWGEYVVQVWLANGSQWGNWQKHIKNIKDQENPSDAFYVMAGTIADIPTELVLHKRWRAIEKAKQTASKS